MTNRELLELAAKAAGYDVEVTPRGVFYLREVYEDFLMQVAFWNPLQFDGDALRLAVKLGIDLRLPSSPNQVFVQIGERGSVPFVLERIDGSPLSATRRAITRAAAEIGKAMT